MSNYPAVEFNWPAGDFRLNLSDAEKAAASVAYENLCVGVLKKAVGQRQFSRSNFGPVNERTSLSLHTYGTLPTGDKIYTRVTGNSSVEVFEPGTTYEIFLRKTPALAKGSLDPNAQSLLYLPDIEPGAVVRHDCELGTQSHGVKEMLRVNSIWALIEAQGPHEETARQFDRLHTANALETDLGLNTQPIDLFEVENLERLIAQSEVRLPHPGVRI